MKKIVYIFTALLFLATNFLSPSLSSQTKFNVNIIAGYTLPVSDLKGSFPDTLGSAGFLNFSKASTLLVKSGFGLGAIVKYSVDSTGSARVTGGLQYNSLSGSVDYVNPITRGYKSKLNIFTISAGLEYNFYPKKKFSPFVGLDLAANFFSGKIESSGDSTNTIKRKSESRFGVIATGGVDIKLSKNMGVVVGVKYALANLIGKKTELTTTTTTVTDDEPTGGGLTSELPLNDAETSSNKGKSLNYLQFYVGLSVNFGKILK